MDNIIRKKQKIATDTYLISVHCPLIARAAKPGQFVILRVHQNGERIPLTIADNTKTDISIIFKAVGYTTRILSGLRSGSSLLDLSGPLGKPSSLNGAGNICFVGGGVGIAAIYPLIKAMKKKGNNNIAIIGAKSKNHLFWLDKLKEVSDKVLIATEDGSMGKKGFVTDILKTVMRRRIDTVYTIGPTIMMKNVSKLTWRMVKTNASLNTLMIDGIGMCGGCRIEVGGKTKFACIDGPEFDAHKLDWDMIMRRNSCYIPEEKTALKKCRL